MKKLFFSLVCWLLVTAIFGQTVSERVQKAFQQFEKDGQLKHALSSLYVIDAATGAVVFDKNSQIGLAGASTQKIITAATAFEILGKDYRYKTELGYRGEIKKGKLEGDIIILGGGDPTFGSWRWKTTGEQKMIDDFIQALKTLGIKEVSGSLAVYREPADQAIPDRWIVQDIGNYYGASPTRLNWRENQFDLFLKSGKKIGDAVTIVKYEPKLFTSDYTCELTSAAEGSGDNAYIYLTPKVIRGTIPVNENNFKISGAMENPDKEFIMQLYKGMSDNGIDISNPMKTTVNYNLEHTSFEYTHYSPSLDSIVYWFLRKSINLYGEALLATLTNGGFTASADSGINFIKNFWKDKGLDEDELNIYDGSGLSPMNRITTHAQVEVLKYAKTKNWFPYYYDAFPEYNAMKMKSGTIGDVKGFCGYHKAKDGKEYIFSFLVNNYNGKTSAVVNKMYKVLDELK